MIMKYFDSFTEWISADSREIKAIAFDIDGVFRLGREIIPGSNELISFLRGEGIPFSLLTNDGSQSAIQKAASLSRIGLDVNEDEIVSCSHGLISLVDELDLFNELFFVMGRLGSPCYAETAGLRVTRDLGDLPDCRGIILSEENYDWESCFRAALNYFINFPEGLLLVPNPDLCFPWTNGVVHIGPGSIAGMLINLLKNYSIDLKPHFLGKPEKRIFSHFHMKLEKELNQTIDPSKVIMLGDALESDIRGGKDFGYLTGLMMTGMTTGRMLDESELKPDYVFDRL